MDYRRCISRWIKQKIGKEEYNYKPTLKSLFNMLKWAKKDLKNKDEKVKHIINYSKEYRILRKNDIKLLVERNNCRRNGKKK